jgi:GNAT superfamily N-acetyltransferase
VTSHTFTVEDNPSRKDVDALSLGLNQHSRTYTEAPGFQSLGVFMRNDNGVVVGGVWGYVNWNWLWIGLVWLSDELRGGGYGKQMMNAIEHAALDRGCRYSHLDTFSFQARPFYESLGYEVFATLDDYPPGHQRFFLKKSLI